MVGLLNQGVLDRAGFVPNTQVLAWGDGNCNFWREERLQPFASQKGYAWVHDILEVFDLSLMSHNALMDQMAREHLLDQEAIVRRRKGEKPLMLTYEQKNRSQ